jgi:hypothetical protein
MKILIRILLKIFNLNISEDIGIVDNGKIQKFLFMAAKDDGWKNYYTLRKKSLLSLLSLGTGYNREYWEIVGRIKELKAMSVNVNSELSRRKEIEKKERIMREEQNFNKTIAK